MANGLRWLKAISGENYVTAENGEGLEANFVKNQFYCLFKDFFFVGKFYFSSIFTWFFELVWNNTSNKMRRCRFERSH